jgi:hypothetical protein
MVFKREVKSYKYSSFSARYYNVFKSLIPELNSFLAFKLNNKDAIINVNITIANALKTC